MSTTKQHGEPVTTTSADITAERLAQLQQLFPEAFSEGRVDFDKLRAALGDWVDDRPERYQFTWAGKKDAIRLLQTPTSATLVPVEDESVNWNTTQNLFIEGDNLEVLKLLYKSYFGRVKMIYIDPPYNTGNDFIYPDDFRDPLAAYERLTGDRTDEGDLTTSNRDTGGRFHSAWLTMMYPRLFLARQLLRDNGVIFVSIADHEVHNLRLLMNEIFGEENYLATFVWVNEGNIDNQSRIKRNHEYVVVYAKYESLVGHPNVIDPNISETSKLHNPYIENTIVKNGPKNPASSVDLPVGFPAGFEEGVIEPKEDFWPQISRTVIVKNYITQNRVTVTSGWSSKQIFENFINNGFRPVIDTKGQETTFFISDTGAIINRKKRLEGQSHVLTVLKSKGTVQGESARLSELGIEFDYPKPSDLLKYLAQVGGGQDSVFIDFFAGSCPLSQAVLELNREDNGNRRFIMVQLPEPTGDKDFPTIADIGKERIRRVIAKMQAEDAGKLDLNPEEDLGFKVFKLAASHLKPWSGTAQPTPDEYNAQMALFTDPLQPGWTVDGIIYEVALKAGYSLTSQITGAAIAGNAVYKVTDPDKNQQFHICLDDVLSPEVVTTLGLTADDLFICRDIALDDTLAANLALQCRLKII